MIRTYLDSGVLILGASGRGAERRNWEQLLADPEREFLTGPFVEMETLLHATREKRQNQMTAYQDYLGSAEWFGDLDRIIETARQEILRVNIPVIDACHLATAYLLAADEFVTTEGPRRSIYRNTLVKVVPISR